MTRQSRVKEYAKAAAESKGVGREQDNIDHWAKRAEQNSQIAPHPSGGPMKLHSTGKQAALRDTDQVPFHHRKVDARMAAKEDQNVVGNPCMRGVRRNA